MIYGRYVDPAVPALVAVSLARLVTAPGLPRLRWLLAGLAVLTLAVAALRSASSSSGAQRQHVASLPFVTGDLEHWVLVGAGTVAATAIVLFGFLARSRAAALAPVTLGLFCADRRLQRARCGAGHTTLSLWARVDQPPRGRRDEPGAACRVRHGPPGPNRVWIYQRFMPHTRGWVSGAAASGLRRAIL
jgi:hypothetical protein